MSEPVTVSTRISDLNLEQLVQVHNMVRRQQEALVAESQALGVQLDAIRDKRATLAAGIAKYNADMDALVVHIKAREAERDAAERAAKAGESATLGEVLRIDGSAPGALIEASTSA